METRKRIIAGLDIIVILVVASSALIGLVRGLMRELLSLIVWISAILGALSLGPKAAGWLELGSDALDAFAGYAIVFVAIIILGAVMQKLMAKAVDATGLSGTDRMLGLAFGSVRGLAICLVAFVAMRPFVQEAAWWQAAAAPSLLAEFEDELLELIGGADAGAPNLRTELL